MVVEILAPRPDMKTAVGMLLDNNLVLSADRHRLLTGKLIPLTLEGKGEVVLDRPAGLFGQDTGKTPPLFAGKRPVEINSRPGCYRELSVELGDEDLFQELIG